MKNKFLAGLAMFALSVLGGLFTASSANATLVATDEELYKLSLLSGLTECYQAGIKSSIQKSDFSGLNSVLVEPNKKVNITTHIGNTLSGNSDNDLKCSELINGWHADRSSNSAKGINQLFGVATTPEDAGYKLQDSTSDEASNPTQILSFDNFQGDTSRETVTFEGSLEFRDVDNMQNASCTGEILAKYQNKTIGQILCSNDIVTYAILGKYPPSYDTTELGSADAKTFDAVKNKISEQAQTMVGSCNTGTQDVPNYIFSNDNLSNIKVKTILSFIEGGNSSFSTYVPFSDNNYTNASIAIDKLGIDGNLPGCSIGDMYSGGVSTSTTSCRFSQSTTYALYYRYVEKNDGLKIQECGKTANSTYKVKNGSDEWCAIAVNDMRVPSESYSTVGPNGRLIDGTMADILNWLSNENNYSLMSSENYADQNITAGATLDENGNPTSDDPSSSTTTSDDPCWNADLDSMAWILCPAESNLNKTATGLFGIVQEWLEVDTTLYDSTSPTHEVWGVMRNIANFGMIIILLVVIISQLTGVGIDNYGIKKLLPKLILMAILINLSFLICQLAVDLSNILGVGLKGIFDGVGEGIKANSEKWNTGEGIIAGISAALMGGGTAAAYLAPTALAFATSGGSILIIILALLTIVIAIIMFFLSLGARLLIIIVCIAVAPIAFICYILPNTKNIYKQWWKLFESALIIFPLCGALWGISELLQNMILGTGSTEYAALVVALVAPFLVFFLLPSLLKKSIAGLGVIGGALTAMGGAFKSGIGKGVDTYKQNSENYKNAAEMGQRNFKARQAQNLVGRLNRKGAKNLNDTERMQLARMQSVLNRQTMEDAEIEAGITPVRYEAALARAQSKKNAEELESEISLLKDDTANYDTDMMSEQLSGMLNGRVPMNEIRAKALMKKLATSGGYGQKMLAKTVGGASKEQRAFAAAFMSKDSDVASAIARKDGYTAQYLREVNSKRAVQYNNENTTADTLSYNEWLQSYHIEQVDDGVGGIKIEVSTDNNESFVTSYVLTDDRDFASQSAGVVEKHVNSLGDDRIRRIINNARLMDSIDGDVHTAIMKDAERRHIIPIQNPPTPANNQNNSGGTSTPPTP